MTTKVQRQWAKPKVECVEVRPEVTAYSGDTGPWLKRNR